MTQFYGELAGLSAAGLWAVSSVVYGLLGQKLPPLLLNCLKGVVAIALLGLTLLATQQPFPPTAILPLSLLAISGIVGIGIGDTAYFTALVYLGARRTLLLEILVPPMAALLAFVFLQESLSLQAWGGILLTIIGVAWVITERTPDTVIRTTNARQGIGWGLVAAIAQAIGAVLSRSALITTDITPLWSTLVRLVPGTLIAGLLWGLAPQRQGFTVNWSLKLGGVIIVAAFGSTYLGIWLQQTALKFAPTGIAQTLLATSPLFVLPIARLMGETISWRSILGVCVALCGISILFF